MHKIFFQIQWECIVLSNWTYPKPAVQTCLHRLLMSVQILSAEDPHKAVAQSPRLYSNAMSMVQRQSPLDGSYPLQSQLSGLSNHAFGSLASMNGGSALDESIHGGNNASWISIEDLQAAEVGTGGLLS